MDEVTAKARGALDELDVKVADMVNNPEAYRGELAANGEKAMDKAEGLIGEGEGELEAQADNLGPAIQQTQQCIQTLGDAVAPVVEPAAKGLAEEAKTAGGEVAEQVQSAAGSAMGFLQKNLRRN